MYLQIHASAFRTVFVAAQTGPPGFCIFMHRTLRWERQMDMRSTLTALFPAGLLIDRGAPKGDLLEVHGLPKGAVPQNCEVLAGGRARTYWGRERQEIYLVKTEDFLVLLRICPAGPGTAEGDFAVSRGYSPVDHELTQNFQATALKSIDVLCGAHLSRWPD